MTDHHAWDEEKERQQYHTVAKGWTKIKYLTFCGLWVSDADSSFSPKKSHEKKVTCTACILLHFEREARRVL